MLCRSIRVQFRADTTFVREIDGVVSRIPAYFHTDSYIITESQPLDMSQVLDSFNAQVDAFNARGNGYVLERVRRFVMCILQYRPLVGSSYIPSPRWLKDKRCAVNVKNLDDNECFKWSILACLHEQKSHKDELYHYLPYRNTLNFDDIEFPVQTTSIPRFEKHNQNISVNVLSYDTEARGFCVVYISPHRQRQHHVNLLLLDEGDSSNRHYVWISNMSRLLGDRTKHRGKTSICNSCLHPFSLKSALENHVTYCMQHPAQMVEYPDPNNVRDCVLKFKQLNKQHPVAVYLVCDFESYLVPEPTADGNVIDRTR